jgi:hypothetical protein
MDLDICKGILEELSKHYTKSTLGNDSFDGLYGFRLVFRDDGIDEVLQRYSFLKPFLDESIDSSKSNVYYLNSLTVTDGKSVKQHVDNTISGKYLPRAKTASEVSVLYLQVPNDMVGGKLSVYHLDGTTECVEPKVGKLFKFDGRFLHSVDTTITDFERISLVLESYSLEEWEYELIPKFYIDNDTWSKPGERGDRSFKWEYR